MTVEIHNYVMGPPWAPLWLRGDVELDPEDT
jgi:hypothetical protein